jgi:YggT family protein
MVLIGWLLWWALRVYSFVLVARIILDWVRAYNRSWRPKGALFVAAGIIYALTDAPLRLLRRVIPPLRLGPIALDIGTVILFFVIGLLQNLVGVFLL